MSIDQVKSVGDSSLLNMEPLPAYRDKTWEQAAGQREISVPLDHLPEGITFGPTFPEPIHFDPIKKRLHYRGLMYHGSYSYLRDLDKHASYLVAIDQLYALSSNPPKVHHYVAWTAAVVGAVAVAGLAAVMLMR